ncbi:hypothetical protein QEJ31_15695 [Pigmentibacter sp. JX0631]|uniref:hypothetical protein n=1 Tax=Pigmentibacter sp. JX0631 TaxID=2976982 RepID=UPI0024687C1F|nr:hypothetical protein [Pigmentibacter sp. JX0631]WGL59976.1 hypothetical protein QEJ31_15695 [Pigmentibacter sp. JX0631]
MKNKKKYVLIFVILTIFFVSLFLNKKDNIAFKHDLKVNQENGLKNYKYVLDISKKKNVSELEKKNSNDELLKEKVEVTKMINLLKDKYTYITFEKEFKDKFFSVYYSGDQKNIIKVIQDILLDKEMAIKIAGDNQAYARVFAIKSLKELAIIGNQEPIIDTISKITKNYDTKQTINKGEEADLYDLVSAFISIQNSDELESNLGEYLTKIGFSNKLNNKELKDIFDQSVFFSLKLKFGREKTSAIMAKYFSDA